MASIEQLLPLVVARIQDTRLRLRKGQAGVAFRDIHKYLKDVEPEVAAAIACKVTFDKVFATKKASTLVPNVTDAIGQAVENECMMRHYEAKVPGLSVSQSFGGISIGQANGLNSSAWAMT